MKHLNFELIVFQNLYSLNTGRVNNQTTLIAMATATHRVTFLGLYMLTQLYDVTSQLQLGPAQQIQIIIIFLREFQI